MDFKPPKNVASKKQTKKKSNPERKLTEDEQIDLFVKILVNIYLKLEHEKDNNVGKGA